MSKLLGVPVRRLRGGKRIRTEVLKTDASCWDYTKRKTRQDAISAEVKQLAYDFWLSPENSRPSGNKKDIKRSRLGPKTYTSHMVHVLEKTQSEVYDDFKQKYPEIKISLRSFENCKPYFVRSVRPTDRQTCCCRYHIELNGVFKSCMRFRKTTLHDKYNSDNPVKVFERAHDMYSQTICANANDSYSKLTCLKRTCDSCGVHKLQLLPEELDKTQNAKTVKWEKFEYVDLSVKDGKSVRKLELMKKETTPGELFEYLKTLLETFPLHQHRAQWQNEQYKYITINLPEQGCVCVHDFSENYQCSEKMELQSKHFSKTEVTIHISVIHRHAKLEHDGMDSTNDNPVIIQEYFYVISPDLQHDQYFVHHFWTLIKQYLTSIDYDCQKMFEFTDGCAQQYKSRCYISC